MKKQQKLIWIMTCCILLTACSSSKKDVNTAQVSPISSNENDESGREELQSKEASTSENTVNNSQTTYIDSSNDTPQSDMQNPEKESSDNTTMNEEQSTKNEKKASDIVFDDKSSVEAQRNLIANKASIWAASDTFYDRTMFAITDLNQNGRYEVILSSMGGTGMYTFSSYYEVNENYDNLIELMTNKEEGDSQLDIMVDSTLAYYDANTGIWSYQFEDYTRIRMDEGYLRTSMLSLEDDTIIETILARYHVKTNLEDENGASTYEYTDGDNNEITKENYENILATSYSQQKPYTVTFGWIDRNSVSASDFTLLLEKLEESSKQFTIKEK